MSVASRSTVGTDPALPRSPQFNEKESSNQSHLCFPNVFLEIVQDQAIRNMFGKPGSRYELVSLLPSPPPYTSGFICFPKYVPGKCARQSQQEQIWETAPAVLIPGGLGCWFQNVNCSCVRCIMQHSRNRSSTTREPKIQCK